MFQWISRFFRKSRPVRKAPPQSNRQSLTCENLEDRLVPAGLPLGRVFLPMITTEAAATDFLGLSNTAPQLTVNGAAVGIVTNTNLTLTGATTGVTLQARVDNGAFTNVAINNGAFSFTTNLALDGSADADHTVTFVATGRNGLTATDTVTFTLNAHAPVVTAGQNFTVGNNAANGSAVGPVVASDVGATTFQNWTIASGNTGGAFAINPLTGQLTVANSAALTGTFNLQVTVSDGVNTSTAATVVVNVVAAPVVTPGSGTAGFTENGNATVLDDTFVVTDADSTNLAGATIQFTNGFVAGQDILQFANQNGINGTFNVGNGTLTLTGNTSLANYILALRTITYTNNSENPSAANRTISITVNDGLVNSTAVTRTVTVTPVNDAPTVSPSNGTVGFVENGNATALDSAFVLNDVDNTTLAGATVHFTGGYVNGEDLLNFSNQNGITGSFDSANGTLTLTGNATLVNYQAALRSITYSDTSNIPSTANRTVSITVNDGALDSTAVTRTITVTSVNDAPVVSPTSGNSTFVENGNATVIDDTFVVTDVDNTSLVGATIHFTGGYVNGDDLLNFTNQNGINGTFDAGNGTLTLAGNATLADYIIALRTVTYFNGGSNTANRTLSVVVDDGAGVNNLSTAVTRLITISPVNTPPSVSPANGTLSFTENANATPLDAAITVTDPDSPNLASATITFTSGYVITEDLLSFTNQDGITGFFDAANGTLTLTGSANVTQYQNALRSITYTDTSDNPSAANRTLSIVVNDGSANSTVVTRTISVTPVNDAPAMTPANATVSFTENGNASLLAGPFTLTDLDDDNLANATLHFTSGFVNGQDLLSFTNTANITSSFDAANGTLRLTGNASIADYKAALQAVLYTNSSDDPSVTDRVVSIVVNDGTDNSATITRTITITAVNDAPEVTPTTGTADYTIGAGALTVDPTLLVVDVDSPNLVGAVVSISSNFTVGEDVLGFTNSGNITGTYDAGNGTLTFTGNGTVSEYETVLASITYNNTNAAPNTNARMLTFQVNDGAAANNLSANASLNITLTAANNAPVLAPAAGNVSFTENGNATLLLAGPFSLNDDGATLTGATLHFNSGYVNGQDLLNFTNTANITSSFDAPNGTLTLSGNATLAEYDAALLSVTFTNSSDNPSTTNRVVAITVNDGVQDSNSISRTIFVTAVNDAPVVTHSTASATFIIGNVGGVLVDPNLNVSDVDSALLTGATVTIVGNFVPGEDSLDAISAGNITVTADNANGTLFLTGTDTVARYQNVLQTVFFDNNNATAANGETRVLAYLVDDGVDVSSAGNITVQFSANATQGPALLPSLVDDTGVSNNDFYTSNATILANLTIGASALTAFRAGFDTVTAPDYTDILGDLNNGNVTLDLSRLQAINQNVPLTDGIYTLRFYATDVDNNLATGFISFTLDTTAPTAPTLTLSPDFDSGTQGDLSTIYNSATLIGTKEGDTFIALQTGGNQTSALDFNTDYSLTDVALPTTGNNTFSAVAVDRAGNTSNATLLTVVREAANLQVVKAVPNTLQLAANGSLALTLNYDTDPSNANLTGLGLRLYFNGTMLENANVTSPLTQNLTTQNIVADTTDDDGDPNTTFYIETIWTDVNGAWPGTLPSVLYIANFTGAAGFVGASTTINIRATALAGGFELFAAPVTISFI